MSKHEHEAETNPPTKNLRVKVCVTNNALWRAIRSKYKTVNELCRSFESLKNKAVSISNLVRFKRYPFRRERTDDQQQWRYSDEYIPLCLELEKALGVPAQDLFPKHLYDHLVDNETTGVLEVSAFSNLPQAVERQIRLLPAPPEDQAVIYFLDEGVLKARIQEALNTLTAPQRNALQLRFGLCDHDQLTYGKIAKQLKCTKPNTWLAVERGLKKLQNNGMSEILKQFL